MEWITVERSSLSVADVQSITVKGKKLTLVYAEEKFYAFAGKCSHAGGNMSKGWCKDGFLVCPVHRYQYALSNGRGAPGQGDYLKTYPLKQNDTHIMIGIKKSWFKFW